MHLLKLLADNRGRGQFRAESAAESATIYLYDVIVSDEFWGGISAKAFVRELNALTAPVIHLRLNTPGGDVFAARAIEQAIREHPSRIIAHNDGLIASAGTYPALAAAELVAADGSLFMIHNSWTVAYGNAEDLLQTAALLEKIDGTLINTYAKETGQTVDQIKAWMDAETWFTAQEAIDAGFADAIAEGKQEAANAWNLAAYTHAPYIQAPEPPREAANTTHDTEYLRRRLRLAGQN